ncbi:MAG: cation:proton antiporter [Candidatus Saliniplasma sp.]
MEPLAEVALLELGIVIVSLAVVAGIARYINESDIPFFIVVGILLGPYGIGRFCSFYVGNTPTADLFIELGAELGVMFLLFFMGLSFSVKKLIKHRNKISLVGTIDLLNFAPGILIGYFFFRDLIAAFLIGGVVYISSSAVISKSLLDLGWDSTPEAEQMLERLVFEDLVIVIYLSVMSTVIIGEGANLVTIAKNVGFAMLFVIALILVVYLKPEYFDKVLDTDSDELFILRAVGIIAAVSGAAVVLGISEAVAAFFIGIAFGGSEHLAKLQRYLFPFRYLFAGIFFFWIGMETDPLLFGSIWQLLILTVIATTVYKFFTAYYGAKFYELDSQSSTRVGIAMITRGEFSLVIAALAAQAVGPYATPVITKQIPAFAVSYVLVMSILGTVLLQHMSKKVKELPRKN